MTTTINTVTAKQIADFCAEAASAYDDGARDLCDRAITEDGNGDVRLSDDAEAIGAVVEMIASFEAMDA